MKLFLRLAFAVALLGLYAAPASAQYMFLDANGDGLYDANTDKLNPNGTPTTVDVYLITDKNRDGSTAVCDADGTSPLNINSYVVNLLAAGGTVTYSNFINQMGAAFSTNFVELNAGDGGYKNGYGAQASVPAGKYKLATITITGNTAAPSINIVDQIEAASDYTGFGTGAGGCFGNDFDNTYKLAGPRGGTDWTDADGLGPAPGGNGPPTLTVSQNVSATEGQLLTIEATATDLNPADVVTITQTNSAPFLTTFTSTPGPSPVTATLAGTPAIGTSGVYLVTWVASDNVNPPDTVITTVTVNPAGSNNCPVLAAIGDKTVTELTELTFTAVATDADVGQTITYSLGDGAPVGAAIDATTGFFTWTPTDAQGPGTYPILVQATDNALQVCTVSETITVTVNDAGGGGNQCPVLATIGSQTVTEGNLLTFTAAATDPDAGQTLTFSLDPGFPSGASINSSTGVFAWTPAPDQGPNTYTLTVRVADNGDPQCTDSEDILVTVNDSVGGNLCPVLTEIGNKTVTEGNLLTFTAAATDANTGQTLTFSLGGTVPTGASINGSTGVFDWTPTTDQGPGTYPITVRVTDNGEPACADSEIVTVTVNDSGGGNQCPVLTAVGNKTIAQGSLLTFTATATDPDVGQILVFSLGAGAPTGAAINGSTGVFTWTPAATGSFPIEIRVTDTNEPPCTVSEAITVTVTPPGNTCPVLTAIGNKTVAQGSLLTFTATATDPDVGQILVFSLGAGAPTGAAINGSTGVFTWTPAATGSFPIEIRVTDTNEPPCTVSEAITVTVTPPGNTCPVLTAIGNKTVTEGNLLTFTAAATDPDAGQTLTFSLDAGFPTGATINSSTGVFEWIPTADQGPNVYPITVRVTDNADPSCADFETIQVTVNDSAVANQCPVLTAIGDKTITQGSLLTFTATATDPDAGQILTFSLEPGFPAGAAINSATGVFTWTPATTGSFPVGIRVTDNFDPPCSDSETITVTVTPPGNNCPVLAVIGNKTVTEGNLLTFTATATDPDAGQTLTFSLDTGFPTGASINSSTGVFDWTPTTDQGPNVYTITVRVTDSADPSCSDFEAVTVTVNDSAVANQCPVLTAIGDKTITQGSLLSFTATATDPDAGQILTFSLAPGFPAGAAINSATGAFTWTPAATGSFPITIRVTDNAEPPCTVSEEIVVTVTPPGNNCPVLTAIGNKTVTEGNLLTFTAAATDPDAGQTLTFSLDPGFPPGATIQSSTGVFEWIPTTSQGPNVYSVTVRVADNADPSCADFETIQVTVNDSVAQNQCPVLNTIGGRTVTEGNLLTFTAMATDPDAGQILTFSLDTGFPTGASINSSTGVFSWTPTTDQGPNTYTLTVRVTDNGDPACSDFEAITVTVNDSGVANQCPVLDPIGGRTVTEGNLLTFTATASDPDAGQILTFSLDPGAPAGASINSSTGAFTWTPVGTGTFSITVRVTDNASPSCSDFETIAVNVEQGGGGGVTYNGFFTGGDKKTRLWTGKPTTCLQLEVVGAENSSVDLTSLVLVYNGQQISAESADLSRDTDRDGNGEIEVCFAKEDLKTLFADLPTGESTVTLTLQGIATGGAFSIEVNHDVVARGNEHANNGGHGNGGQGNGGQGNGGQGTGGQGGNGGNDENHGNVGNGGQGGGDDTGDDDTGDDVADNSGNDDGGTTGHGNGGNGNGGNGNGNGGNGNGNGGNGNGNGGNGNGRGHHAFAKPNPLNPSTALEFTVAKTGPVRVQVFNATGRLVKVLYDGTMQEGRNTLGWDGSSSTGSHVASGVYYFRIVTAETREIVRVTVLK